ncbi:nuclear transport factor 2 family protein [Caulobacter sp. 1776]|uniref:nuclear transport factor 2 family protein n=1 Tax=Caulobacter sp. 1776 TaxID=3156420 RepID=UPI00339A5F60
MRPAPPEIEALVQRLYDANQRRDFEAFRALVTPDLEWPDLTRGGLLTSPEAVRDYWTYNDASIRVEITPVEIHVTDDGRVVVDANQVVWNRSGQLWSDMCVRHCYTLRGGLFWRMDILDKGDSDPGP